MTERVRFRIPGAVAVVMACVLAATCRGPSADQEVRTASRDAQPSFVGKVWMSTDPSAAPGTLPIFLPDGTLVMDSCGETYRLARWRAINERRIEWQEDTAPVTAASGARAQGRELPPGSGAAQVPFVCPDARPSQ
jgi:hypothetical protein